ncbi:M81 family metallopeptidase [Palleronia sp. LCG004]|uniref:M81 family metallopeptidase n=1 Tax=Palleronia sp. LCG004 TaxID=3079304 RepID=UPI0029436188|nr:M81 family metallopeptidase [Palleronia sp. LCG004]WOI58332.1 M81 family metallopeptidase [Palleronia sp. LCG004]
MTRPRAIVLQLFHEASAIAPALVTYDEFLARHHLEGEAVRARFGGNENWLGGCLEALDAAHAETRIGLCTAALPGGTVAGPDYARLEAEILASLDGLRADFAPTNVFLLLHGALLAEGREDPEGDLVRAVRARVGPEVHIGVALDFHANPGPGIIEAANLVLAGKLYPHTDARPRGARLVELSLTAPELRTIHVPMGLQVPMPHQQTHSGAFADLVALSDTLETGPVADVTLLGGFPFSEAPFRGTSCLVSAYDDAAARRTGEAMRREVEARRDALVTPVPTVAQAMVEVRSRLGRGRVVLADIGDNPGGGGLGDYTGIVPHLVALNCPFAFGFLVLPSIVEAAHGQGEGGILQIAGESCRVERLLEISYRNTGPMMRGEPVLGGAGAVLSVGMGRILVSTLRVQAYDPGAFVSAGIDIQACAVIAIKSSAHFRAGFTALAEGGIVLADSGGLSSPRRAPRTVMG